MTITQQLLRELFHYNAETGVMTRSVSRGPVKAGSVVGRHDKDGYLRFGLCGQNVSVHRMAVIYMTGVDPLETVDHKNGVRDDNRWNNLRTATRVTNSQNMRVSKRTKGRTSKHLGAYFDKKSGSWRAQIRVGGKLRSLGSFSGEEPAAEAYLAAKREHHQGCTI